MNAIPDTLNRLGVLNRREVEVRILAPLIEALAAEFGRERVLGLVRRTILDIARRQGADLAQRRPAASLTEFGAALEAWKQDGALEMTVLAQDGDRLDFNVTRCRYAEMYQALGVPELGEVLSCNRDAALIEGYDASVTLTRSQTIMQGAPFCDFRYRRSGPPTPPAPQPRG